MAGVVRLEGAARDGLALLDTLAEAGDHPISAGLLPRCDSLVFTWTVKAGLLLGVSTGSGFLLRRLGSGRWSAPLFLTVTAGAAGAIVGVEMVSTVLLSMTPALLEKLEAGGHTDLGADLSLRLGPGPHGEGSYQLPTDDDVDLISYSVSSGVMLDFSLRGGSMKVDAVANQEVYGVGTSVRDVVGGRVPPPAHLKALYSRIEGVVHRV